MATKTRVKQMIRTISKGKVVVPVEGLDTVDSVNAELNALLDAGWALEYVDCLDRSVSLGPDHKDIGLEMFYVLVLPV